MRKSKFKNERGAGLVEYSLLVALIAMIAVPSVSFLGKRVAWAFCAPMTADEDENRQAFIANEGNVIFNEDTGDCGWEPDGTVFG